MGRTVHVARYVSGIPAVIALALVIPSCTTVDAESSGLFFTAPREAVAEISALLTAKDWPTLARYYDLSGTDVRREDLESGEFFYTDERPEVGHPAGFWHYRHPFAPAFQFESVRELDRPDIVEVTVAVEIEQGGGLVQRGLQQFLMKRSDQGYQVLPGEAP